MGWAANWYKQGDIYVNAIDKIDVYAIKSIIELNSQLIEVDSYFRSVKIGVNVIDDIVDTEIKKVDIEP